jgi:hypothetical protein
VYRVTLTCHGIPPKSGPRAASDITAQFFFHRPWHQQANCTWDGELLILEVENDFDSDGLAALDEFSAEISGCVEDAGNGDILVHVSEF